VSSFTAYIIFTFKVRLGSVLWLGLGLRLGLVLGLVSGQKMGHKKKSTSVRLRCHLANKVSVRCG